MKKFLLLIPLFTLFSCSDQEDVTFLDGQGVPIPTQFYVNDFTGEILDTTEVYKLNQRLKAYEDSTTTQIVVICLPKLPDNQNGDTWNLEELATKTFRTWGIGQKEKNNGVLLLIAFEDRKSRIETGYGAEGALPDIICGHILDEDLEPNFKDKDYYEGIDKTITSMQKAFAGEYLAERKARKEKESFWVWLAIGLGVCAIVGAILKLWFGGLLGGFYGAIYWYVHSHDVLETVLAVVVCAVLAFIASFIVRAILLGGDSDSSYSSSGWSSGSSGSSGGGFSGGGGSSGGGGASGGW